MGNTNLSGLSVDAGIEAGAANANRADVKGIYRLANVAFDPLSIGAVTKAGTAITVTGAAVGDIAVVLPRSVLNDDLVWSETIVTANTVTQYLYNPTAGAIDQTAINVDVLWIDIT